VAEVAYTYKRYGNIWDAVEINQIWDPSGSRVVGYVDGQNHTVRKYTTPDANWRVYQGIDFSVESRPTPNWDLYAAYTLSWLYGPGAEQFGQIAFTNTNDGSSAFANPRQALFYDGFLPEDVRHQLKVRASYSWHGLGLGANFTYQTGLTATRQFFNQNGQDYWNKRSPQGTDPGSPTSNTKATLNDPTRWSELRSPDVITMNARLQFDFYDLIKQHVMVIADFFNLFNLGAAQNAGNGFPLQTANVASYGLAVAHQTPFRFQLGLRYVY
jgi:hypothetical protein